MEDMNLSEVLEKHIEREIWYKCLLMIKDCKTLDELEAKIKALLK